ncbi:hypothetical protein niasHS_007985 [Heterodera schachtii]|uniref:B30.2/SPRY domain-containing protein n=1 Tax=Heterodera schachtii TaxID=97005 RepID=A0ABD2JQ65_HETSC
MKYFWDHLILRRKCHFDWAPQVSGPFDWAPHLSAPQVSRRKGRRRKCPRRKCLRRKCRFDWAPQMSAPQVSAPQMSHHRWVFQSKSSFTAISSADEFSPFQPLFPNLSTSEEMSVLNPRIAELNRAAAEERFSKLQNDQQKKILEKISELEKQQKQQNENLAKVTERLSQLQNDQLKILEKFSELEKQTLKKVLLKFQQNFWDEFACHEDIEIIGDKRLTVKYKSNPYGWPLFFSRHSVFAKHPILLDKDSSDIFYYEISNMEKEFNYANANVNFSFGFAIKQQKKLEGTIHNEKGTYAYESDGYFWINGERKGRYARYCSYGVGDTVGIGVNSVTRQLFFTKNGFRLDSSDLFVAPSFIDDSFYPFVTLCSFVEKIEANFGSENFKFKLSTL